MPELSALEHLKVAKRLHFQGMTEDAVREYESVLEIDPDNGDAIQGLRALGVEPKALERDEGSSSFAGHAGGLKTNFFTNQSKSDKMGGAKTKLFNMIILCMGLASAYGLYVLTMYLLNFDNIAAAENVSVVFEKPSKKDNIAFVNVSVVNLNPAPIKHIKIKFRIASPTDATLKEGVIELPGYVPAGDRRTFAEVELGAIDGVAEKITTPEIPDALIYGPKPKIKDKYVEEFKAAAAKKDKEALEDYEILVDNTDDFAPAHVGLGRAYAAKGNFKVALEQYDRAIDLDPMNANAHYYKAVALFYKGDKEVARKEIDTAAQIAPDDPEILWNQKYMTQMKIMAPKTDDGKSKSATDAKTDSKTKKKK